MASVVDAGPQRRPQTGGLGLLGEGVPCGSLTEPGPRCRTSQSGTETAAVSMADGRKAKSWPERGSFIVKECVQQSFRLTRGTHSYFCVFIYCRA